VRAGGLSGVAARAKNFSAKRRKEIAPAAAARAHATPSDKRL
jgi:hypothetical protein